MEAADWALLSDEGRIAAIISQMKPIPLLDSVGSPIFILLFLALLFLQWKYPLRRRHFSVLRRLVRNYVFSLPAFVLLGLTLIPIPLAI